MAALLQSLSDQTPLASAQSVAPSGSEAGVAAFPLALLCADYRVDISSEQEWAALYEWATTVDRDLRGGVLLSYDGWGHGVLNRSDCTRNAAQRYLVDLTTPRPGTHCPAVPPDYAADARVTAASRPSPFA